MRTSDRELEVLRRLAGHRYLSRGHLEAFLFDGADLTPGSRDVLTRRVLRRLVRRGLVSTTRRVVGGPGGGSARLAYFLTDSGAGFAGAGSRGSRHRPGRGSFLLAHSLMAADVALAFTRAAQGREGHELIEWESVWQPAKRARTSRVVPDARLVYRTESWRLDAFVEIDLATEGTRYFAGKIRRYLEFHRSADWRAQLPTWPVVLTITPTAERASALRVATESVLAWQPERLARAMKFAFTPLEEVLGPAGPLGAIWQVAGRPGLNTLFPDGANGPSPSRGPTAERSLGELPCTPSPPILAAQAMDDLTVGATLARGQSGAREGGQEWPHHARGPLQLHRATNSC